MNSIVWDGDEPINQPWGCTTELVEPYWLQARCHWHCGMDIGSPGCLGKPFRAAREGHVSTLQPGILGIQTDSGQTDYYVHGTYLVKWGQFVFTNQLLGHFGNIAPAGGFTTGPHLHFEVQDVGGHINVPATSLDPMPVLSAKFGDPSHHMEEEMRFIIGPAPSGAVYAIGDAIRHIGPAEWSYWQSKGFTADPVTAATLAEIVGNATLATPGAPASVDLGPVTSAVAGVKSDTSAILAKVSKDLA